MPNNIEIDDGVTMELLQEIYEQYVKLSKRDGVELPEFGAPNIRENELRVAYLQYLKSLPMHFASKPGCKKPCKNGTCPPCPKWKLSEYEDYLEHLRALSA